MGLQSMICQVLLFPSRFFCICFFLQFLKAWLNITDLIEQQFLKCKVANRHYIWAQNQRAVFYIWIDMYSSINYSTKIRNKPLPCILVGETMKCLLCKMFCFSSDSSTLASQATRGFPFTSLSKYCVDLFKCQMH